jgi:hypothetical protein
MAEHRAKQAAREAKAEETGKKPGGKPPKPPVEGPQPKDQINLTDEDSRIMPVAGGGFEQCYNAQAVVAVENLLVIAVAVVQAPTATADHQSPPERSPDLLRHHNRRNRAKASATVPQAE